MISARVMVWKVKHVLRQMLQKYYYNASVDRKLKKKIENKERIRVLFVCHRPAVWGALKTVYEAFSNDDFFETLMVTVPQKDDKNPNGYVDEGADEFFAEYQPILGFNKITREYKDIKNLAPDIVFYQQPYDVMRSKCIQSSQVNKYAKIGYVTYFSIYPEATNDDTVLNTCYPMDFFRNISYFFAQNKGEETHIRKLLKQEKIFDTQVFLTGYPKYDNLEDFKNAKSNVWNREKDENSFRILWTPRWTTNENNCHFFAYKDAWMNYCKQDPAIDLVFRPHPQTWIEWDNTGEFTKEQLEDFRLLVGQIDNMSIDETGDYLNTFYSSDCLVSDMSSMVLQYLLTEKPIIYCHNKRSQNYFMKDSMIGKCFYWAENWDEVKNYLIQLKNGIDPLKDIRMQTIRWEYKLEDSKKAGVVIKEIIKDALVGV